MDYKTLFGSVAALGLAVTTGLPANAQNNSAVDDNHKKNTFQFMGGPTIAPLATHNETNETYVATDAVKAAVPELAQISDNDQRNNLELQSLYKDCGAGKKIPAPSILGFGGSFTRSATMNTECVKEGFNPEMLNPSFSANPGHPSLNKY